MTGLSFPHQGNHEEDTRREEDDREEEAAAAAAEEEEVQEHEREERSTQSELGDGQGVTPPEGSKKYKAFEQHEGKHCSSGRGGRGPLAASGLAHNNVTLVECKRRCQMEEDACRCLSHKVEGGVCHLHASCEISQCSTDSAWVTQTVTRIDPGKFWVTPQGAHVSYWKRAEGEIVAYAEWATKTLEKHAALKKEDPCLVGLHPDTGKYMGFLACTERSRGIRTTPNMTLDLPYNSSAATENPVHQDEHGPVDSVGTDTGCLSEKAVHATNKQRLIRGGYSCCTSCDPKGPRPILKIRSALEMTGSCQPWPAVNNTVKTDCTQQDFTGWKASPAVRNVMCMKWGRMWTDFAPYKLPQGPMRDHFTSKWTPSESRWLKAQCSMVKHSACRYNPATNASACVAKKSVKCETVCPLRDGHADPSTWTVDKSCDASLCEGKYGSIACR